MKTRFTKGQTVFQVHLHWSEKYDNATDTATDYIKITEEVVESCGQKRLLIYNDSYRNFKQFDPYQKEGYMTGMCLTFHSTFAEAEKAVDDYIEKHSGKMQGIRKVNIEKMN